MSAALAICLSVVVIDGDTIICNRTHVRIAGIDTPEIPGHCRRNRVCTPGDPFAAKSALATMLAGRTVRIIPRATDRYGRTVAVVLAGNTNVGCALIRQHIAVARYGDCR
jgi:micrococcal nuclease